MAGFASERYRRFVEGLRQQQAAERGFRFTPAGRVAVTPEGTTPGFYETDLGQRELAVTRRNEIESAVRGAQLGPAEQRAARSLAPLVAKGLVSPAALGSLLTKSIASDYETQQQQRQISREAKAIKQQARAGRLTDDSLDKALYDLHSEYSTAIYANPDYADIAGLKEQRQAAIDQQVADATRQNGVKMTWNERQHRVVFDRDAAEIEMYKSRRADAESERKYKAETIHSKNRDITLQNLIQRANLYQGELAALHKQGKTSPAMQNELNTIKQTVDLMLQNPELRDEPGSYTDEAAFTAAYNAKQTPPGIYIIGGVPYQLDENGGVTKLQ